MTLVDLQQVKSVRTKLIDFISEYDCYCSSSWHYSVNAGEQHRKRLEVDSFKRLPKRVLLFKQERMETDIVINIIYGSELLHEV